MEYFDVLDNNRNKLNYIKERGSILLDNEYNAGVEIWIFNNNKLLVTKRSLNKSHPGEWEVPGGCSQAGENPIDTLIRELKEELCIDLTLPNSQFLDTQLYKKQFVDIYKSNISINLDKIKLQKDEVSDIKFVTKDEFLKMASENKIVKSVFDRFNLIKDKINLDW